MVRVVMALGAEGVWGVWRQGQWMAEVRRNGAAAGWRKLHFDMDEDLLARLLQTRPAWQGLAEADLARQLQHHGARLVRPAGERQGLDGADITGISGDGAGDGAPANG